MRKKRQQILVLAEVYAKIKRLADLEKRPVSKQIEVLLDYYIKHEKGS